jgi:hypothetical protein
VLFPPNIFWRIPAQANTRSFKEIVENEEENIALFSGGVDVVTYGVGEESEVAAYQVLY